MISVCMACYNGQKYIRQQIDSILSQLTENDELIISDDGSKDLTCAIVLSYHDPRAWGARDSPSRRCAPVR